MSVRKWSKERVIRAIQERHRRGLPMRNLREYDQALTVAAAKYFGSWGRAMSAAGLGALVRKTRKWTKQDVIEGILARKEQGLPLKNVASDDKPLARAALSKFGGWREAVLAAGLEPEPRGIWNREMVLEGIQRLHAEGIPLDRIRHYDKSLVSAAVRQFGNWGNAVRAAGFPRPRTTRRQWTKQLVIEAIRQRHRQGRSLTGVSKEAPSLAAAALNCLGGWHKAIVAAGLEPKVRRSWSKEIVIREIQARHQRGLPMTNMPKHDATLSGAAGHYFGSWKSALVAAGLEPRLQKWSRQRVIEEVKAWVASGRPLSQVWTEYVSLTGAARRHIGSWHEVLEAAGLESEPQKRWSEQRVIEELQAWHRGGSSGKELGTKYRGLKTAVQRYFGHWHDALAAAGLEPTRHRKWSKQRVVQEIQNRHVRGVPIRIAAKLDRKLVNAAARHFGTWATALEAAGVVRADDTPRRRQKWCRERVIAAIQARHKKGLSMVNVSEDDAVLSRAAARYLGGWRRALEAAGLQPRPRPWDRQRIIAAIRLRHQHGMATSSVWRDDRGLFCAAKDHFGSWHDAMLAAGVTSDSARPRIRWSKQRVIDEIQARYREGLSLNCTWPPNRFLLSAARRYIGNWRKALRAAGITPEEARRTYLEEPNEG